MKKSNFINSFRNVFRRKNSNAKPEVKVTEEVKKQTEVKQTEDSPIEKPRNYQFGGCRDRNLSAIYYPPKRGKIKGYMKANS